MVARKTPQEFKKEFYEIVKDEYTLLTDYELSNKKVKVRHNTCGNVIMITPNSFLRGNRCRYCNGNLSKLKTNSDFINEVYNLVKDEYVFLENYINRKTPIKVKHNVCDRIYKVEPCNFLSGSRCIECYYESLRLNNSEFYNIVADNLGDKYEILSDYKGMYTPVELKHKLCGTFFYARPSDIKWKQSGCPFCKLSKGEHFIETFFKENDINYESQKTFDDLRDINKLSYDFYLPSYNILIEFQGIQHYMPKTFGGITKEEALNNYNKQIKHDKLKDDYAKSHDFKLLTPNYKLKNKKEIYNYLYNKLNIRSKAENP